VKSEFNFESKFSLGMTTPSRLGRMDHIRLSRADRLTKLIAFKAKQTGIAASQATYRPLSLGYDAEVTLSSGQDMIRIRRLH
jgi:hypothetical protein